MESAMINLVQTFGTSVLLLNIFLAQSVLAEDATPRYNTKIPKGLLTPDKYSTRAGDIEFFDGIPTAPTAEALYNHLDYIRGVQTFLNGIPAASMEAIRRSQEVDGKTNSNQVRIFDQLMDSNPLFLTGNTDTVYLSAVLNLEEDGPTVIEIPPGTGPGTVNDAFFRFVIDTGAPGPDAGKGGKYLILPPDYEGDLDPPVGGMEAEVDGETYFVAKSPSWINWFIARGFF